MNKASSYRKERLLSILGRLNDLVIMINHPSDELFNHHDLGDMLHRASIDKMYIDNLIRIIKEVRMKKLVGLSGDEIKNLNKIWKYWSKE